VIPGGWLTLSARFLFLVVCRAICDCEDYDIISDWGEERIDFLRRYLPYEHALPGGRWLTIVDEPDRGLPCLPPPARPRVRETWPENPDFVAIDGKNIPPQPRQGPLKRRLCTWSRPMQPKAGLVPGQEAVFREIQ